MAVRMQREADNAIYFITFTCYRWKPLFELADSYDCVYEWFDYLYAKGAAVLGFVVMPNHLHTLLHFPASMKSVNTAVGNAKRFMAYEIIKRLEVQNQEEILQELFLAVKESERRKGQKHKVFEDSFDAKHCHSLKFIEQKLSYMHYNPVRGKWNLIDDFALYPHSSAGVYYGTETSVYKRIMRVDEIKAEEPA